MADIMCLACIRQIKALELMETIDWTLNNLWRLNHCEDVRNAVGWLDISSPIEEWFPELTNFALAIDQISSRVPVTCLQDVKGALRIVFEGLRIKLQKFLMPGVEDDETD